MWYVLTYVRFFSRGYHTMFSCLMGMRFFSLIIAAGFLHGAKTEKYSWKENEFLQSISQRINTAF